MVKFKPFFQKVFYHVVRLFISMCIFKTTFFIILLSLLNTNVQLKIFNGHRCMESLQLSCSTTLCRRRASTEASKAWGGF